MLVVPACYAVSGGLFLWAQAAVMAERRAPGQEKHYDTSNLRLEASNNLGFSFSRSGGLLVGFFVASTVLLSNLRVL
jgi:hypothetical protein